MLDKHTSHYGPIADFTLTLYCFTTLAFLSSLPAAAIEQNNQISTDGATVEFSGIQDSYLQSLAKLSSEARRIYAEEYGFKMPGRVELKVEISDSGPRLWTDGESHMTLLVKSQADLAPPMKSGVFNIYGICHELGHIAMYNSMKNQIGLPAGIGEGWAHYTGSIVVDEIYKKFGKELWPEPYNYAETEGTARLKRQLARADNPPEIKAAVMFYWIQQKYGRDVVFKSMQEALSTRPSGNELMPRFVNALAKTSGKQMAEHMVPAEFRTPKVRWEVKERKPGPNTFEGLSVDKSTNGALLKYDDGASDGKISTNGSGHAVLYKTPAGKWSVDYIELYGGRYGSTEPPKENFIIYFCDQDFNVIKQIEKPYSTFPTYEEKWYKISFDPVKVPEVFYVCVFFDPSYYRGVYMHYDTTVKKSHSRIALPWTFVADTEKKLDWMIRVHLKQAK